MNNKGVQFIHERTRRLTVGNKEEASQVLHDAIASRAEALDAGKTVPDLKTFTDHLVWLLGFDTLTDQRDEIHRFVDKIIID
jgi:hypothetical protein